MQKVLYLLFLCLFSLDYLSGVLHVISNKVTLAQEFLSLVAGIFVLAELALKKLFSIHKKYIIFIIIFGLHIFTGFLINNESSGAIVAGMRGYLKYFPFFLLPIVYEFSEDQISRQLKFILFLAVLQLPITVIQRFVIYSNVATGDAVRGTLATSSILSIILISTITILFAFYLRKMIARPQFLWLLLILFIPTTINETKGTLVLLPVGVFLPLIFMRLREGENKKLLPAMFITVILFGGFVQIYNAMTESLLTSHQKVSEFFTSPDSIILYLAPRTSGKVVKEEGEGPVGRIDFIVSPLQRLSEDPVKLLVGLGMGNVTQSPIDLLSGDYAYLRSERLVGNSISFMLWEIGILGVFLYFMVLYMIFSDARYLSDQDAISGTVALGWIGIVGIYSLSLFYKDIIPVNVISYLFWYFSGYVVANSYRYKYLKTTNLA